MKVFVSYSSEDKERVTPIVDVLERHGINVWWDRNVQPGQSFGDVIEAALGDCNCVIVVWTNNAVRSRWVKAEAAEGARRGILVPAQLDEVKIPLEFRGIQSAQLLDWNGNTENEELSKLVSAVTTLLKKQNLRPENTALNDMVTDGVATKGAAFKKSIPARSKFLQIILVAAPYIAVFLFIAYLIWVFGPIIRVGNLSIFETISSRSVGVGAIGALTALIFYIRRKSG